MCERTEKKTKEKRQSKKTRKGVETWVITFRSSPRLIKY